MKSLRWVGWISGIGMSVLGSVCEDKVRVTVISGSSERKEWAIQRLIIVALRWDNGVGLIRGSRSVFSFPFS